MTTRRMARLAVAVILILAGLVLGALALHALLGVWGVVLLAAAALLVAGMVVQW